jgi:hypothetical protein
VFSIVTFPFYLLIYGSIEYILVLNLKDKAYAPKGGTQDTLCIFAFPPLPNADVTKQRVLLRLKRVAIV